MKTILSISVTVLITLQCIILALAVPIARQRRQLPCTHTLRLSVPELFTHCDSCTYGDWSSWQGISGNITNISKSLCPSGKTYTEERTRTATGSSCNEPVRETQRICN